MNSATRVTVSTFGALAGLAGIEHGVGEVLQGNLDPEGVAILSWPETGTFSIRGGEPAMTLVPNLLATGMLAILVSLLFLVWTTVFVGRKHGGRGPRSPDTRDRGRRGGHEDKQAAGVWRAHLPAGARRFLARMWPWSYVACVVVWLMVLPGTILLDHFFAVGALEVTALLLSLTILCAFGLLLLTILAGFARDVQREMGLHTVPLESGQPGERVERRRA